jgi:beta-lactamase superfamily II metal-dependent hydrolase
MFHGIEVDVLSLGDADCTVVTKWENGTPHRILIDGGSGVDAETIIDFLLSRRYTYFWAVICTHLHNDHARGLIKLLRNRAITFSNGWMHDITKHVSAEALRRASLACDGVKEVIETTKELAAAFASRNVTPMQPFAGMGIAAWPEVTVLGPSLPFYKKVIGEFTEVEVPAPRPVAVPPLWTAAALALGAAIPNPPGLSGIAANQPPRFTSLASLIPQSPSSYNPTFPPLPLTGALGKSSVKKNPTTQPYNNTSVILGVNHIGGRLLFTADAGSEALASVPPQWNHLLYMSVPHHGSDGNLSQRDIERFCPQFATISAKGDSSHPSRAIVSGLVKVGAKVASTHKSGNLQFSSGVVPPRGDYSSAELLKGTGEPEPIADWAKFLYGLK